MTSTICIILDVNYTLNLISGSKEIAQIVLVMFTNPKVFSCVKEEGGFPVFSF